MTRWLFFAICGVFCLLSVKAQSPNKDSGSDVSVLTMSKYQVAALDVAIHEMRKMKLRIRGQQARLSERDGNIYVSFLDDPIDMTMVGSENGLTWEIRKRDSKLLRVIHDR
jgi:hypothetical protein